MLHKLQARAGAPTMTAPLCRNRHISNVLENVIWKGLWGEKVQIVSKLFGFHRVKILERRLVSIQVI